MDIPQPSIEAAEKALGEAKIELEALENHRAELVLAKDAADLKLERLKSANSSLEDLATARAQVHGAEHLIRDQDSEIKAQTERVALLQSGLDQARDLYSLRLALEDLTKLVADDRHDKRQILAYWRTMQNQNAQRREKMQRRIVEIGRLFYDTENRAGFQCEYRDARDLAAARFNIIYQALDTQAIAHPPRLGNGVDDQ
jgi:chromosome segregation ATPase